MGHGFELEQKEAFLHICSSLYTWKGRKEKTPSAVGWCGGDDLVDDVRTSATDQQR